MKRLPLICGPFTKLGTYFPLDLIVFRESVSVFTASTFEVLCYRLVLTLNLRTVFVYYSLSFRGVEPWRIQEKSPVEINLQSVFIM